MRILYLNPCGRMGGAELSLVDVMASIRAAEPNWELHLVIGENGPLVQRAQQLGVATTVVPFPRALARLGDSGQRALTVLWNGCKAVPAILLYALRLHRTCSAIQPDIIHTNGFKMHILALWARARRTPVIWHVRDYIGSRTWMRQLLRFHAGRCAAAIGNSKSVAADVEQVCGARFETLCVYNAIDLTEFSPVGERADLDSLSGLAPAADATLRIGLIATMAHWKGHGVFLRALAALPAGLSYRAYIVGGAIYQTDHSQQTLEELRALAAELGISERVGFTGYVRDTSSVMRALNIVVHASTAPEPFGRVVAEGLASGRAVIYSSAGGAAELVTEGVDGLGHAPGDERALAARILELAGDPALRERLGRAGRITAEQRFERGRLAGEIIPLYRRIAVQSSAEPAEQLAVSR